MKETAFSIMLDIAALRERRILVIEMETFALRHRLPPLRNLISRVSDLGYLTGRRNIDAVLTERPRDTGKRYRTAHEFITRILNAL
jgi:hypothetical protein